MYRHRIAEFRKKKAVEDYAGGEVAGSKLLRQATAILLFSLVLPLPLLDKASILAKLNAMEKPRTVGPGLLRFRMGGTSDGRECRHHHLGMVALM